MPSKKNDPPGFALFWEQWPKHFRKVDRAGCLRHWQSQNLESAALLINAGLMTAVKSRAWAIEDGKFIPMPLTWLRQRRWEAPVNDDSARPLGPQGEW